MDLLWTLEAPVEMQLRWTLGTQEKEDLRGDARRRGEQALVASSMYDDRCFNDMD